MLYSLNRNLNSLLAQRCKIFIIEICFIQVCLVYFTGTMETFIKMWFPYGYVHVVKCQMKMNYDDYSFFLFLT